MFAQEEIETPRPKNQGYVFGTPAKKPVLRPLRYPLYDTEPIPTPKAKITLFLDNKRNNAGVAKTEADTNMPSNSQLGSPLEYDLIGLCGYLAYGTSLPDWNNIYNGGTFKWIFSQSIVWLIAKLHLIPQGIGPVGATTANNVSILANGQGLANNFFNFTDQNRKARKILSTESFRNEVDFPAAGAIPGGVAVNWTSVMVGMLYGAL